METCRIRGGCGKNSRKCQDLRACQKEKGAGKNEEERTSWKQERDQEEKARESRREERELRGQRMSGSNGRTL